MMMRIQHALQCLNIAFHGISSPTTVIEPGFFFTKDKWKKQQKIIIRLSRKLNEISDEKTQEKEEEEEDRK